MTEENLAEKNPAFSFCPSGKFRFAKQEKIGTALGRFRVFKYAEILKRRNGNFQKLGKIEKHMREIPILGNVFLTGRNDARFILAPLPEEMRFSKHGNLEARRQEKPIFKNVSFLAIIHRKLSFFNIGKIWQDARGKKSFSNTRIIWIA